MTYCVAVLLDEGLVFASDSRTNAGVDHVSSFRKMRIYEQPGDYVFVILSSGNLSVTQSAINALDRRNRDAHALSSCSSMLDVAELLSQCLHEVKQRDGPYLQQGNVEVSANFIIGGQVRGEQPRLFLLRCEGEILEAQPESPFFQIGETKYGKPIIDRVIKSHTPLRDAAKCLLISFDSTMRSNVSVGLPIDLCTYRNDSLRIGLYKRITEEDPYFRMIHHLWSDGLRQIFAELPDPYLDPAH
ncbi:MAG TPA: peptidase [Burkholderiales bacterium]|nr:peptidase [Burkholderiales bacterium]